MTLQFALGGAFSIIMWTFGLLKRPQIDADLVSFEPTCNCNCIFILSLPSLVELALKPLYDASLVVSSQVICAGLLYLLPILDAADLLGNVLLSWEHPEDLLTGPWSWQRVQIKGVLPLAVVHTLGNLLTNISLGKVAVSFTHTIKVGNRLIAGIT